jgi:hypothetical protein
VRIEIERDGVAKAALFAGSAGEFFFPFFDLGIFLLTFLFGDELGMN